MPPQTNGKATASMVLGILSLLCGALLGVPALVFGILARSEIDRSGGRTAGSGRATAGIVMGCLSLVVTGALPFLLPLAVQRVREAAERAASDNNLKQITLAVIAYSDAQPGFRIPDANQPLPGQPAPPPQPDGTRLSWRVAILPYLDKDSAALYREFRHDEPWDSDHNKRLITRMPKVFALPGDEEGAARGLTYYRGIAGEGGFRPGARFPASILNGTSRTIMVAEVEEAVPWTKPDELVYREKGPLPRFSSRRKGGFEVGMWDGTARTIPHSIDEEALRDALNPRPRRWGTEW